MITDEEAAFLLRQANPVPNLDDGELDDIGPAEYRTLLESTRIAAGQTLDQSTDSAGVHTTRGTQHLAWVAAAVVVLMAGLASGVLRQGSDGSTVAIDSGPATTAEPASSTTVPTTTAESAPSTTVPATTAPASALSGIPVWLGFGDGQWTPPQASVPFAFTATGNWNSTHAWNTPDRFTICVPQDHSPQDSRCINGSVSVHRLGQGNVEATKEFLTTFAGAELSGEEPVTIDGADGIRFRFTHDISGTPGGLSQGDLGIPAAVHMGNEKIPIGVGPLGTAIVSIVDVSGDTMTIVYQGEDASKGAIEDGFNINMQAGQRIIDSIIWADN